MELQVGEKQHHFQADNRASTPAEFLENLNEVQVEKTPAEVLLDLNEVQVEKPHYTENCTATYMELLHQVQVEEK